MRVNKVDVDNTKTPVDTSEAEGGKPKGIGSLEIVTVGETNAFYVPGYTDAQKSATLQKWCAENATEDGWNRITELSFAFQHKADAKAFRAAWCSRAVEPEGNE